MAGGAGVLIGLAVVAAMLLPPYYQNWRFHTVLDQAATSAEMVRESDEVVRAIVSQKAAALGLPVQPGQVQVERHGGALRLEVRYAVRVDLPLYTVDLHFHPVAGR